MAVSQAKLEANRRNAQKSVGPRTEQGKERSRRNAIKHGLRAESLLMLDEDPQELEVQKVVWRACLVPRDEVELSVVDDAVEYAWMQDRARRAQVARLATNIANVGIDQAVREADEVMRLGQKLFAERRGLLVNYPHDPLGTWDKTRVSESDLAADPEDPQRLVLHLQSTAGGCQWMLDRWSELRSILDEGLNWQSADKFKAVRLLGRQPLEAVDDRNLLTMFVACQTIEGQPTFDIREIWNDLRPAEKPAYVERLRGRGIDRLAPADAAAARQVLFDIIDRATAQIKAKADEHRRRADVVDALTPDRLLFDDSPEGERLRRYELANGRAKTRSLNELRIRQRSPLFVVSDSAEAMTEAIAPNEPTGEGLRNEDGGLKKRNGARENAPNEPTEHWENAPNEPTEHWENAPNEPTACWENAPNEPTACWEIAPNEPTACWENAPNEPTACWENAPNEPTACWENAPNEPTDGWENAPNEPTQGSVDELGPCRDFTGAANGERANDAGPRAPTDGGGGFPHRVAAEEPYESFEDALKRIRLRREEHTRQLNEQARQEAAAARAIRHARSHEPANKNGQNGNSPEKRAASSGPRTRKRPAAPTATGGLDE
jgi:hypothetical protein